MIRTITAQSNYTIPSDNRELQRLIGVGGAVPDYTIPSDNRELQLIIIIIKLYQIIPYQVITGNYNGYLLKVAQDTIIPYQVITGNYNGRLVLPPYLSLIHI